jgi:hypothetical protein
LEALEESLQAGDHGPVARVRTVGHYKVKLTES